jgi:drug/metabolite transporter (DMT)-like permease
METFTPVNVPAARTAIPVPRPAWFGWTVALFSTACFSLAPVVGKAAIDLGIDAVLLLTLRLIIATFLLGTTTALARPGRLRLPRRSLAITVATGLANGIAMVCFFVALTRLDSSVAAMILSLGPLVVLVLLALRGERFTYRNLIRLGLGLTGAYLLIGPGGPVDLLGALLVLVAVLFFPLPLVTIQWYLSDEDPWAITLYMVATMALVSAVWWLIQGAVWTPFGWQGWALLGILTVVSTYLARLGMFVAVRALGGGQVGLLGPVETMLTVLWSVVFLGDRLTWLQWLAAALIALSALMAVQRLRRVRWQKE